MNMSCSTKGRCPVYEDVCCTLHPTTKVTREIARECSLHISHNVCFFRGGWRPRPPRTKQKHITVKNIPQVQLCECSKDESHGRNVTSKSWKGAGHHAKTHLRSSATDNSAAFCHPCLCTLLPSLPLSATASNN